VNRIEFLTSLQDVIAEFQRHLLEPSIEKEIAPLLHKCCSGFLDSSFDIGVLEEESLQESAILMEPSSSDVSYDAIVKARLGLETIRLWKQLCQPYQTSMSSFQAINAVVQNFELTLKSEIQSISDLDTFSVPGTADNILFVFIIFLIPHFCLFHINYDLHHLAYSHTQHIYPHPTATVVLYFDHIEHETPSDHVENQKRCVFLTGVPYCRVYGSAWVFTE
jgi:hypothetical protein